VHDMDDAAAIVHAAPVAVSVGGIDALRMDVAAAPGASVCDEGGASGFD
jgi:hypothetical protein